MILWNGRFWKIENYFLIFNYSIYIFTHYNWNIFGISIGTGGTVIICTINNNTLWENMRWKTQIVGNTTNQWKFDPTISPNHPKRSGENNTIALLGHEDLYLQIHPQTIIAIQFSFMTFSKYSRRSTSKYHKTLSFKTDISPNACTYIFSRKIHNWICKELAQN